MIFKQHVPNCVDLSRKPALIEFNTLEELLSIPYVNSRMDNYEDKVFSHFALSDNSSRLMAVYNEGYYWWVVGSITGDTFTLDLPVWKPKYTQEYLDAKKARVEAERAKMDTWWKENARMPDGTKVYNEN